jgi:Sortase domain
VSGQRRRFAAALAAGCGAVCIAAGVVGLTHARSAVDVAPVGTVPVPVVRTTVVPTPTVVSAPPVGLSMPDRHVTAPVVPVDVDPDGAVGVPDPPTTVGWWSSGARPGDPSGTVVIVGHIDSRTSGLGALAVLPALESGEPIDVRDSDGHTARYRVVARRQYHKVDLPLEVFAQEGPARLVLITCGGQFDRKRRSYEDNVVVYALPDWSR